MSEHHGGPAFPVFTQQYSFVLDQEVLKAVAPGMTLRDYFAAKAMQTALTACAADARGEGVSYCEHVAKVSYEMADAMLKAREAC